jgi:hypothetical protein
MRIRISDPTLLADLSDYLRRRTDAIVKEIGEDELEVSLLGSYAEGPMRMELYLRVRAWEAGRRGARVELVDD